MFLFIFTLRHHDNYQDSATLFKLIIHGLPTARKGNLLSENNIIYYGIPNQVGDDKTELFGQHLRY